jgi:type VI protein secretion system component VasK
MGYRAAATVIMWVTYLGMIWASMTIGQLGAWAILLAFVLMMPLIPIMGMLWGAMPYVFGSESSKSQQQQTTLDEVEKRKRDRLDAVLRDLSDEDLQRLKRRLSDGTVDDSKLYQHLIGDDGELVDYNR